MAPRAGGHDGQLGIGARAASLGVHLRPLRPQGGAGVQHRCYGSGGSGAGLLCQLRDVRHSAVCSDSSRSQCLYYSPSFR